jgi:hypothetical protein
MTKVELTRQIALRIPVRIVELRPRRGVRAGDAMRKLREQDAQPVSALLQAEQDRLWQSWQRRS